MICNGNQFRRSGPDNFWGSCCCADTHSIGTALGSIWSFALRTSSPLQEAEKRLLCRGRSPVFCITGPALDIPDHKIVARQIAPDVCRSTSVCTDLRCLATFHCNKYGALIAVVIDLVVIHTWHVGPAIFFLILLGVALPLNVYTFAGSVRRLWQKVRIESNRPYSSSIPRTAVSLPDKTYLEPFIGVIAWSIYLLIVAVAITVLGHYGQ